MYKSEQLAQQIRQQIENGSWHAHDKLPSLREQVQLSGFSLITVMNAYQELEAQGLVYAKEKSGYFVAEQIQSKLLDHASIVSLNSKVEINSLVFQYLKSTQSPSILPLGSAFPDSQLLYTPKLLQIMGQHARHRLSYDQVGSLPPGNFALRQLIAQRYRMQGIPTDADDIVITSGCLDALNLALQTVAKAGDYILLQQTIFYGAWQAAERLGLKVITIPEHPKYGFDLDAFTKVLKTYPIKVCWLMLNSHNPIGFTVSDEIKYEIAKLLHEYQIYLIEDDVYEEMYYGGKKPLPMKYFDQQNLVLHCSSFSKTLGAGFRVGWVYAGKFSNHIQHLQLMSTISVNALVQHALVDFLSSHHYEKHLRSLRLMLERCKKQFYQFFKQNLPAECEVYYYPSGYFLWLKLPKNMNSMHIYEQLLQQNISVAPSPLFNVLELQQHFLRVNCSFEWSDQIEMAMHTLIACIRQNHTSTLKTINE